MVPGSIPGGRIFGQSFACYGTHVAAAKVWLTAIHLMGYAVHTSRKYAPPPQQPCSQEPVCAIGPHLGQTGYSSVGRASDCRHLAVIRWSLARFRVAGSSGKVCLLWHACCCSQSVPCTLRGSARRCRSSPALKNLCVPLARMLDRPAIAQLAEHLTVDTLQ